MLGTILIAVAAVVFLLATLGVALGTVPLVPLGLTLLAAGLALRAA